MLPALLRRAATSWPLIIIILLLGEVVLSTIIIKKVPYTEIDWKAYMDEVQPVIQHGERNYSKLRGETGPLVYPAGFVWLYAQLWSVTDGGSDILQAQYIHLVMYVVMLVVVAAIYRQNKNFPAFLVFLFAASKRIHSIFLLRMFNDCPTMVLLYLSILLFSYKKFFWGIMIWTLALSIKMNALLVLPAILLVLVVHKGWIKAIVYLVLSAAAQYGIGFPFISFDANAYRAASFNFSRVFKQKWSVNFKWVPCDPLPIHLETLLEDCTGLFSSKEFGLWMLISQLLVLSIFAWFWVQKAGGVTRLFKSTCIPYSPEYLIKIFFITNFVGIAFARSLHFQFYIWYFHTLLFLVVDLRCLPSLLKPILLLCVELSWNPWKGESSTVCFLLLFNKVRIIKYEEQ